MTSRRCPQAEILIGAGARTSSSAASGRLARSLKGVAGRGRPATAGETPALHARDLAGEGECRDESERRMLIERSASEPMREWKRWQGNSPQHFSSHWA